MADFNEAFNAKFGTVTHLTNHTDVIDCFFTQRKVTEYDDIIDKNMNRKQKKKDTIYNFIAINIPHYNYIDSNDVNIYIKVWGDEQFKYIGSMTNIEGHVPSLLLKLSTDKQLFINIKMIIKKNEGEIIEKEHVTFINIPKRYQIEPTIQVNV